MRLLLSNDDGLDALGLQTLHQYLSSAFDCTLVAPDRDRSGASNSLTLTRPLRPTCVREKQYKVDGTPSDCVNLAMSEVIDGKFDAVISGINHGPNLGDDVIYSGTVAAAMEARHLGRPSIAVSLVGNRHFDTAAKVIVQLLKDAHSLSLPANVLLNINVPDVPFSDLKGTKVTRLGYRHQAHPAIPAQHPKGLECYWIGALAGANDAAEGTDFHAVAEGYVSITPIHTDMTCHGALNYLNQWVNDLPL
ncbi:5'/3'-nucleotidase SurE [Marinomonas ostreistagni]|uniref:5'/3'-nucleotidase SurE n=1 Tax=Marinomonas ostreistagni TaxID=359209 RepID=UPI00194DB708|nr:5'/3'-nucleotidase SurE [Marinomonas ostreistagni]MBM6551337.1 5'/3'-nucleotidase SurE [Marinomonas ostreistagni]